MYMATKMPQFHHVVSPKVPNPLFLYEISQLDAIRNPVIAQAIRVDLSKYLQLDEMMMMMMMTNEESKSDNSSTPSSHMKTNLQSTTRTPTVLLQSLDHQTTEDSNGRGTTTTTVVANFSSLSTSSSSRSSPFSSSSLSNKASSSTTSSSSPRTWVSICSSENQLLRHKLVAIGIEASNWILQYFITLPEIMISSPDFFRQTLEQWKHDPCVPQNK